MPRWAIVITLCLSYGRRASCVINIYLVNTPEATVLLHFSWNYTRMFVLMTSQSSSNMGHVKSKTRSLGQISLKLNTLEATVLLQSSWNYTRMFVLMMSWSSLNMGHVGSKARSLGQIALKPCSPSRATVMLLHETLLECLSWWYLGQV